MLGPLLLSLFATSQTPPPWRRPFADVLPPERASSVERLPTGASLAGRTLTFLARSETGPVTFLGGLGFRPMHRIPGSDLWTLSFRMPDWSRAFVTYSLLGDKNQPLVSGVWRGSKAPGYPRATRLAGTLVTRTLVSAELSESRDLHIYLPPGNVVASHGLTGPSGLPAFFLTDGQDCEAFARALEPLILAHRVKPCAIVGVDSGGYRGDPADTDEEYDQTKDDRARDYLPPVDPPRFERHLRFFVDEVGAYVATEFGISRRREDRAVMGFSNGGAFCAAVARRRPGAFAISIPMSPAIENREPVSQALFPRMMFVGGDLEPLGASARAESERLRRQGARTSYLSFRAGHDSEMWHLAFSRLAPQVFPVRRH